MLEDFPLAVAMPLGQPSGDFTAMQNAYRVETPYGLREGIGGELEVSHALGLSTPDDAAIDRLNAIVRGRLRFVPTTATEGAQLHLQPLPFEQVQIRERLLASSSPAMIIYGNVDAASIPSAITSLLTTSGLANADAATVLNEFMAGNRWLTVDAGVLLGRPALDSGLGSRRRLDLIVKDRDEFFLNPAYFIFEWPLFDLSLEDHPLKAALEGVQHRMLFATKSRNLFVKKDGGNVPPFTRLAHAAITIGDALVEAQPGDIVIVYDTENYAERIDIPDGVKLISKALRDVPWRAVNDTNGFPTISRPGPDIQGPIVVFQGLRKPSSISGFIITGGIGSEGHGIKVSNCLRVEIAQNKIHANGGLANAASPGFGGGISVTDSAEIAIERNLIQQNGTYSEGGGGIFVRKSKVKVALNTITGNQAISAGGGILVQEAQGARILENQISENQAGTHGGGIAIERTKQLWIEKTNKITNNAADGFGGGIAVMGSKEVMIRQNEIGGLLPDQGNRTTRNTADVVAAILERNPQGGGGGIGVFDSEVKIIENQIVQNEAHRGGGIEFYANSSGRVYRNTIKLNLTRNVGAGFLPGGDGGGVAVNGIATTRVEAAKHKPVDLEDNIIEENVAGGDGGGVYATAGTRVTISGSLHRIKKNTARENGGGARATFGAKLSISGGEILENEANLGNGTGSGGGVSGRNATVSVANCQIRSNTVRNFAGGGVSAAATPEPGGAGDLKAKTILQQAYDFIRAEIQIVDCAITNNEARGNAGAGGGLYVVYSDFHVHVRIFNSTLSPNTAAHTDPTKATNVVIQDADSPQPIVNDTNLPGLTPLANYDNSF